MKTKNLLQGKAQTLVLSWYPWMVFDAWWLTVISPAPRSSDGPVVPCTDLGKISRSTYSPGLFVESSKSLQGGGLSSDPAPQTDNPRRDPAPAALWANYMDSLSQRAGPALYSVIPATLRVMRNPLTSLSHSLAHTYTHSLTHIYTQFNSHNLKGKNWPLPP